MTANSAITSDDEAPAVKMSHSHQPLQLSGGGIPKRKLNRKRQRLDPSTSRVVVVGAGLAGLSAALSLKRAGFSNITVYERDPSLSHQKEGYGLTLTYNPKGPLADLGVLETVAQRDCPSRSHYLFKQEPKETSSSSSEAETANDTAVPMGYFGNAFFSGPSALRRGYGQRGNLRVPRKVLRKILHDELLKHPPHPQLQDTDTSDSVDETAAPTPSVHWNSSLVDFKWDSSAQQYHVRFAAAKSENNSNSNNAANAETTTVVADLLVAADGIRSSVLQQLYNQKILREEEKEITAAASASAALSASAQPPLATEHEETNSIVTVNSPKTPILAPSIHEFPERYGLRSMGIRLILGIADGIDHPLLRERGFYTVDTHGHRLFTMPYRSNRFDDCIDNENNDGEKKSQNRIMWQLSFSTPSNPKTLDPASLRRYVLETFETWHPPVLDLVRSTPPLGIWGTDLMDRDPRKVYQELVVGGKSTNTKTARGGGPMLQPRLAICGDALHSMSPFKGQGANQALADGPLLAKWLSRSSIDAALTNWWREALNRTVPVVEASRKAARDWHDPHRILATGETDHKEYHGFAGVRASALPSLVETLKDRKIGPHLGGSLDQRIREVISEHGWFETVDDSTAPFPPLDVDLDPGLCERVLKLAADGDTEGLRKMSLPSSSSGGDHHHRSSFAMVTARDAEDRSVLHLAALGNHSPVCKWLLAELRILEQWNKSGGSSNNNNNNNNQGESNHRAGPKDKLGKTAFEYAVETGNKALIRLFEVVMREP